MLARNTILYTSRLRLRLPSIDDIPDIFAATRFPGFNDGMGWDAPKLVEELIDPFHRNIAAWESGRGFTFSIETKEQKSFIGRCVIRKTNYENIWNIGFWTHPPHQGNGYMTETVKALLELGFNTLNAKRIEAEYVTWNLASESVLHNNNFLFVGYREEGLLKNGVWIPENKVAISLEEWQKKSKLEL